MSKLGIYLNIATKINGPNKQNTDYILHPG